MKVFATFVLVFAGLVPVHADTTTQTWTVIGQCDPNIVPLSSCSVPAVINATMTTQLTFGTWDCPMCLSSPLFDATVPEVTDISGTFDGMAMTLIGNGGWMYENNPQEGLPQDILFSAGGTTYNIYWDVFFTLGNGKGLTEYMDWSASTVAEPSTFLLLTVPLLLVLSKWAQMSLRKSSAR